MLEDLKNNIVYSDEEIKEARVELWNMGLLYWKLDPSQRDIYDFFKNSPEKTIVLNSSRRLGKSYSLLILAVEQCLQKPKSVVKFLQPEVKMIRTNIRPILDEITIDCPPELMPEFRTQDNIYYFKNGSQLQLAGTDNGNYMKLRGGDCHLALIDEAGFCSELKHIINYILIPTTTLTKGRIILSSTTPPNPDHEFITYMESAQKNGTFIRKTIYDAIEESKHLHNPRITKAVVDDIIKSLDSDGGANSDSFRTEYLCEIIFNSDDAVLPEFTTEVQEDCVVEWRRPVFADNYAAMDIGFTDGTAIIFSYYDYDNAVIVIEDEIWLKGQQVTAQNVSDLISKKEDELWMNRATGETQKPYMRISDNNPIFLNDLATTYDCHFTATDKQNKSSYINKLKTWIKERRVIINPRCKNLLAQMKGVTWDKSSRNKNGQLNDFKRNTIDKHHYDFCFTPGNKVLTSTGYKNIEDMLVGEKVLTHKGRFKTVTNVMSKNYNGEVLQVETAGRDTITCTPEHSFYVAEKYKSRQGSFTGQAQLKGPEWKSAKDFTENTSLFIPDIEPIGEIDISSELCFLYGYYVAEGSLGGNKVQISFAGHQKEKNVQDILRTAIQYSYGFSSQTGTSVNSLRRHRNCEFKPRTSDIRVFNAKVGSGRSILLSNKALYGELKKLGKSVDKKFPDFITSLNKEQSLYMLAGYLFGDGHFSKLGIKSNTISENIKDGLNILYRINNIIPINCNLNKRKGNNQFQTSLNKEQSLDLLDFIRSREDLNYVFQDKLIHQIELKNKRNYSYNFRSQKIEKAEYLGRVYNLEVEDDNSYTVNDIAVHNCDALVYLVRNVDEFKSPYPKGYKYAHLGSSDNVFYKESYYEETAEKYKGFKEQFTPKSSFSKKSERKEEITQFFRKKSNK